MERHRTADRRATPAEARRSRDNGRRGRGSRSRRRAARLRPRAIAGEDRARSRPASARPPLSTRIEVRRRALRGSCGSHWPHSLPILGTPVDVPQPRMRTFTLRPLAFPNNLKKLAVVASAKLVGILAPQLGDESRGVGDERRLALLAAVRDRGEEGRIGLDQHLVRRQPFRRFLQVLGVLEGHDPRQRDIEAEVEPLARKLGRAGEAVEHAGDPLPLHRLGQDLGGILLGVAGVDDERQAGLRAPRRYALRSARAAPPGRTCRNNNRARTRRWRSRADGRRPRPAPRRQDRDGRPPRADGPRRWPRRRMRARRRR